MSTKPSKALETFPNPQPGRDYTIRMCIPEFTCLCPKTGQPDFAEMRLEYVADKTCVELKSLKLYIWSFRDEGHFHEDVTNRILDDLVKATKPRFMRLSAAASTPRSLPSTTRRAGRRRRRSNWRNFANAGVVEARFIEPALDRPTKAGAMNRTPTVFSALPQVGPPPASPAAARCRPDTRSSPAA